jgi:hypothetical protein
MDARQHLYYALGALAYAVAKSDGTVQKEERDKVHKIVSTAVKHDIDFTYTDIIFQLLQKDTVGFMDVYKWAMKAFETGKYHFTDEMKQDFQWVIEQVAIAFPPKTEEERQLLERFGEDLKSLTVRNTID